MKNRPKSCRNHAIPTTTQLSWHFPKKKVILKFFFLNWWILMLTLVVIHEYIWWKKHFNQPFIKFSLHSAAIFPCCTVFVPSCEGAVKFLLSLSLEVSDKGKRHLNDKETFPWCWFCSFRKFRYEFCWVLFFGSVPVILITEIMTPISFSPI